MTAPGAYVWNVQLSEPYMTLANWNFGRNGRAPPASMPILPTTPVTSAPLVFNGPTCELSMVEGFLFANQKRRSGVSSPEILQDCVNGLKSRGERGTAQDSHFGSKEIMHDI